MEEALTDAALWDEVKDKLDQSGLSLSGGQQQRLCIARAIAIKPDIILMDEPCSALDPIATLKIEDLMRELIQDYTIIIVTHNMQQAARVSDFTAFFTLDEEASRSSDGIWPRPNRSSPILRKRSPRITSPDVLDRRFQRGKILLCTREPSAKAD